MLNNKYDLDNIGYLCLKVLDCHHALYTSSAHVEKFGMRVGGFFFPCFEKHDDSRISAFCDYLVKKNILNQSFLMMILQGNQALSQMRLLMQRKRAIDVNLHHILKVIVAHQR